MDKALDLLQQLADKMGQTAGELWPHAVRYTAVDGAVSTALGVLLLVVAVLGVRKSSRVATADVSGYDEADYKITAVLLFLGSMAVGAFGAAAIGDGLPKAIEPTGATVQAIVRK